MMSASKSMPIQKAKVAMARHAEPDRDQKGGKSDKDADDKGFMKLRYRGKRRF